MALWHDRRSESGNRPWTLHVVGRLTAAEAAALSELVNAPTTWSEPTGEVALDMPQEALTLRRSQQKREWAETPGGTSTLMVATFRRALNEVKIESAQRTSQSVAIASECRESRVFSYCQTNLRFVDAIGGQTPVTIEIGAAVPVSRGWRVSLSHSRRRLGG